MSASVVEWPLTPSAGLCMHTHVYTEINGQIMSAHVCSQHDMGRVPSDGQAGRHWSLTVNFSSGIVFNAIMSNPRCGRDPPASQHKSLYLAAGNVWWCPGHLELVSVPW